MADSEKKHDGRLELKEEITNYLPNSKVGNVFSASMHITCAIIGIGVLALPYTFSYLGWIAGPILLVVFYAVTLLSNFLLSSVFMVHGRTHSTYHYAVRDILGRRHAIFLSSIQLFNFVLVNIAFSITGGNAIQQIAQLACRAEGEDPATISQNQSCLGSEAGGVWQAILIFGAAELVLSIIFKSLAESTLGSTIGSICAILYSLIAMGLSFANISGSGSGSIGGVYNSAADKIFGIFNALGQMSSAYGVSLILLEVQSTLRQPPSPMMQMYKSSTIALSTCFVLYMLVGTSGYASKGNSVDPNILNSFDGPIWAVILAYCALLLNMLASFQIFAQALFDAAETNIKFWSLKRKHHAKHHEDLGTIIEEQDERSSMFGFDQTGEQGEEEEEEEETMTMTKRHASRDTRSGPGDVELHHSRMSSAYSQLAEFATAKRTLTIGFTNEAVHRDESGTYLPFWQRAIVRSILVLFIILIGCIMPFFSAFVGLIGTLNYLPLSIFFPIKMFQKVFKTSRRFDILLSCIMWIYVGITLVAAIGAVRSIVIGFSTYKIFGG